MSTTLSRQIADFNEGFNDAIGPDLALVFADEQAALNAAGVTGEVVTAGDTLPNAPLVDPRGEPVHLADAIDGRPTVIVFYRGAWCPYCNLTLKHYQSELLPVLRERGFGLIAISPQTPQGSEQIIANGSLEFSVLSDPGNVLISALGILTEPSASARAAHTELGFDVADSNADATGAVPYPTVLIVDATRTVVFADVRVDYTTRTEVDEIVAALSLL